MEKDVSMLIYGRGWVYALIWPLDDNVTPIEGERLLDGDAEARVRRLPSEPER